MPIVLVGYNATTDPTGGAWNLQLQFLTANIPTSTNRTSAEKPEVNFSDIINVPINNFSPQGFDYLVSATYNNIDESIYVAFNANDPNTVGGTGIVIRVEAHYLIDGVTPVASAVGSGQSFPNWNFCRVSAVAGQLCAVFKLPHGCHSNTGAAMGVQQKDGSWKYATVTGNGSTSTDQATYGTRLFSPAHEQGDFSAKYCYLMRVRHQMADPDQNNLDIFELPYTEITNISSTSGTTWSQFTCNDVNIPRSGHLVELDAPAAIMTTKSDPASHGTTIPAYLYLFFPDYSSTTNPTRLQLCSIPLRNDGSVDYPTSGGSLPLSHEGFIASTRSDKASFGSQSAVMCNGWVCVFVVHDYVSIEMHLAKPGADGKLDPNSFTTHYFGDCISTKFEGAPVIGSFSPARLPGWSLAVALNFVSDKFNHP